MQKRATGIIILMMFLVISFISPVNAEEFKNIKASNLNIEIMPEYDNSDVLVLYAVNYVNTSNTSYSGEIRFPVPKNTTNNIVIETAINNDKQISFRIEDKEDYAELVWQTTQPILPNASYPIHLEYYYNPIPGVGNKTFKYLFTPNVQVDKSLVHLRAPLKSVNFISKPTTKLLAKDQQGFSIYGADYTDLKAGDKIELQISYTKNDPNPSIQPKTVTQDNNQASPPQQNTKSQSTNNMLKFFLVILLGVIAIVAAKLYSDRSAYKGIEDDDVEEED